MNPLADNRQQRVQPLFEVALLSVLVQEKSESIIVEVPQNLSGLRACH